MKLVISSVVFLTSAFVNSVAIAADTASTDEWVGKQVYVTAWLTPSETDACAFRGEILMVTKVDADRVWVGRGWLKKRDVVPYARAVEYLNEALRRHPHVDLYNGRALLHLKRGEFDLALADATQAIKEAPNSHDAMAGIYSNRAIIFAAKGGFKKSLADCAEAIRLTPDTPNNYLVRANVLRRTGNFDEAIADYNHAIKLDSEWVPAYTGRGAIWSCLGRYDNANIDCDDAIRLSPESSCALDARAWLWATCPDSRWRDGERAVAFATRACENDGWNEADYVDTLAAAYAEKGDFAAAVKWQKEAIKLKLPCCGEKKSEELRDRLRIYNANKPWRDGTERKR